MALPAEWFRGVDPEKKDEWEKLVKSSLPLKKLLEIIRTWEEELSRIETKTDEYDNPSWSHKQAHRNGARQAYKKILNLT